MMWIWWLSKVIKAVLGHFLSLTLDVQYLILGAKICRNSASCKFFSKVTKNISMRFLHSPINTVRGVWKSVKKCTKMTSLSPIPVEPLFGRPRDLCPDATFSKMHTHMRFRDDRTSVKWSKRPNGRTDRQTDVRTEIRTTISASPLAADKNPAHTVFGHN